MKKKLITSLILSAVMLPAVFGLAGCKKKDNTPSPSLNIRNAYAMSALSSISYLEKQNNLGESLDPSGRPNSITQFDVDGIKASLAMFDTAIGNGGFEKTVKNNTSQDDILKDYKLQMEITFPSLDNQKVCTMYFTETNTKTKTELDDGVQEIEVNTTFEGVIKYNENLYIVRGATEIETEGNERESSIMFRTYKNTDPSGASIDYQNYVQIKQSFEHDEVEYEYTLVNNGKIQAEMELEYEQNRHGSVVEFQLIDRNIKQSTIYKIYKSQDGKILVNIYKNGQQDTITVTTNPDGTYKFTYSSGAVEDV